MDTACAPCAKLFKNISEQNCKSICFSIKKQNTVVLRVYFVDKQCFKSILRKGGFPVRALSGCGWKSVGRRSGYCSWKFRIGVCLFRRPLFRIGSRPQKTIGAETGKREYLVSLQVVVAGRQIFSYLLNSVFPVRKIGKHLLSG